jgi:ABC-type polysaccharide/polyol phosphate transport system ATPase subunit
LEAAVTQTPAERARDLAAAPPAVVVDGVSKVFRLPHRRYSTLKERALHPFSARGHETLQALSAVSFDVREGEFFGIVGRNGSGKSTMLKCLAGIYGIDSGEIRLNGRLSPFIELGVGFNPDLTARDNVLINAIMLGLTRKQAIERFDEIIAFAELEDFLDLKLKNYSSGMSVRLGFSVAVQVDADILLIDEVLAVGDASFQRKCFDKFESMRDEGRTILFVTHDMGTVERFCDRALLIETGHVLEIGESADIALRYHEVNFGRTATAAQAEDRQSGEVRIRRVWCEDPDGEPILTCAQGAVCRVCVEAEFRKALGDPVFAISFRNDMRHTIFVATSAPHGPLGRFDAGECVTMRLSFENWLAPGRYTLTPFATVWDPEPRVIDSREDIRSLIVEGGGVTGGVTDFPTGFEVERS